MARQLFWDVIFIVPLTTVGVVIPCILQAMCFCPEPPFLQSQPLFAADVAFAVFVIFSVLPLPRHLPLSVNWTIPTRRDWKSC